MKKILVVILVLLLSACTNGEKDHAQYEGSVHKGLIIYKEPENKGTHLLIVSNVTRDEIENKTKHELVDMAQSREASYYYVDSNEYENLKIGTLVQVYWDGSQDDSNPPQRRADKIEVLSEG